MLARCVHTQSISKSYDALLVQVGSAGVVGQDHGQVWPPVPPSLIHHVLQKSGYLLFSNWHKVSKSTQCKHKNNLFTKTKCPNSASVNNLFGNSVHTPCLRQSTISSSSLSWVHRRCCNWSLRLFTTFSKLTRRMSYSSHSATRCTMILSSKFLQCGNWNAITFQVIQIPALYMRPYLFLIHCFLTATPDPLMESAVCSSVRLQSRVALGWCIWWQHCQSDTSRILIDQGSGWKSTTSPMAKKKKKIHSNAEKTKSPGKLLCTNSFNVAN